MARARWAACCGALLIASQPARAGWLDGLFGKGEAPAASAADTTLAKAAPGQRIWRVREFTTIQLAPSEAGTGANRHPAQLQLEVLRQQLAQVQVGGRGAAQALFAADELAALLAPLVQAFERAGPGDDVLLVSTSRRDSGVLVAPTAVTARLFVTGEGLQFIVHDTRLEFYDKYRGTYEEPKFSAGQRATPSSAAIQSAGATSRRGDWLSIPLEFVAAAAPAPAPPVPAQVMNPVPPATKPAASALPAPSAQPAPAVQAAPPRKPLDAAGAEDIERRLETLKRLRDKGLITEEEYQQKRKETLQLL